MNTNGTNQLEFSILEKNVIEEKKSPKNVQKIKKCMKNGVSQKVNPTNGM